MLAVAAVVVKALVLPVQAAQVVVEMEPIVLPPALLQPPTQAAAVVVAEIHLALLEQVAAAQAAPVLSFSRSTSHENLSTHGH
jgi:hypothetical protein